MQAAANYDSVNPLGDLVSHDIYETLEAHNLLSEKGVRDYQMRRRFKSLRQQEVSASDAIELLREDHPYLQYDTIRKIVYKLNR